MSKKIFIAYGCDPKDPERQYGIEVYIIHADDIEEAMTLCPIPLEEVTIQQIYNKKISRCKKICDYYE